MACNNQIEATLRREAREGMVSRQVQVTGAYHSPSLSFFFFFFFFFFLFSFLRLIVFSTHPTTTRNMEPVQLYALLGAYFFSTITRVARVIATV
ncbi:MAG: hypothetical protein J3Q66DRAFT_89636 [Benniella sp.]|nr:MAG: hypothetical protein J3Q66DRAFT_89636 [Benniella sp.]